MKIGPNSNSHFTNVFDICGNCTLDKAEIVVILDSPNNPSIKKDNIELIKTIRKDHLLLVEMTPSGKKIQPKDNELTCGITETIPIEGADLKDLEEKINNLKDVEEKIIKLANYKKDVLNGNYEIFSNRCFKEDLEILLKWLPFITQINMRVEVNQIIGNKPNNLCLQLLPLALKTHMEKKDRNKGERFGSFISSMLSFINKMIVEVRRAIKLYGSTLHRQTFPDRQASFIKSMDRGLKSYEKVMLYVATSHVIKNPQLFNKLEYDVQSLIDYLCTKKFVVINSKKAMHRFSIDIPDLWKESFEETNCNLEKRSGSKENEVLPQILLDDSKTHIKFYLIVPDEDEDEEIEPIRFSSFDLIHPKPK